MTVDELIKIATEARTKAYAPYSNFKVGAAIFVDSGKVFSGCNIENASLGSSICAERVAVAKAVSEGFVGIKCLVVVADTDDVCAPCGICRQVLYEFNPEMKIVMANLKGLKVEMSLSELLPRAFSLKELKKG